MSSTDTANAPIEATSALVDSNVERLDRMAQPDVAAPTEWDEWKPVRDVG